MAGTKEIKRRIKSIRNTKKITKAMELVAASKMKRAVNATLASRLYAAYSWEVLTSISQSLKESNQEFSHPLFVEREAKNILLILITSNRGLCGAYNAQVMKKVLNFLKNKNPNVNVSLGTVGKKGAIFANRITGSSVADFTLDNLTLVDTLPVSKFILDEYQAENYDQVFVAYTDFISALTQRPNIKQILPVSKADLKKLIDNLEVLPPSGEKTSKSKIDYLFEGDKNVLIGKLAEKLTRMQIYQMLLESAASEQSARMMAMKNASDASGEMIEDLTLVFNKARQANITREISEISAGMASVN